MVRLWLYLAAFFGAVKSRPVWRSVGRARTCDARTKDYTFLNSRLELSAIPARAAVHAGLMEMTAKQASEEGYALPTYCSDGFIIPYYDARDRVIKGRWRWRNNPEARTGFAALTKQHKYGQPANAGCYLYLPRVSGLHWQQVFDNPSAEVFVVEGELKALSLCLADVVAVAVGGVWNWSNTGRGLLPELEQLAAGGRKLSILFDSDTRDNPQVAGARYALARALADAGAKPKIIELPKLEDPLSPDKTGADDYIRLHPDLKDEALRSAFHGYAAELAEITELYRLNAQYAINESAARIVRLWDDGRPANRQNEKWTRTEFCGLIENQKVSVLDREGKSKSQVVGDLWLGWKARNRVVDRTYKPVPQNVSDFTYVYEEGRRFLNDFMGWGSQPKPSPEIVKEYWTRLLDCLFHQQSAETAAQTDLRKRARKWFEQWWAYPVQHPGTKLMNAAVLSGQQGGGKDMVGRAVGRAVYHKHYRLISPAELDSNFNASYMESVSLIHAQELTSKNNKTNFKELLKAWITSPQISIEQKYEKAYYANTAFNFYMTTNPEDSIHLDWDDRRYFIWRIADVRIQDMISSKWVADFHRVLIDSEEGRAALHYHLLNEVDCSDFDPNAEPPITVAKQAAQLFSTNEAESHVTQFAEQQRETNPEGVWRVEQERNRTSFREKEFLHTWRRYFQYLGRGLINETNLQGETIKVKRGLWVLKPTVEDMKAKRFPTLKGATERWNRQKQKPKE